MYTQHTESKTRSSTFSKKSEKPVGPFFSPLIIQPKLTIGAINDLYEQEADTVANKVMRMTNEENVKIQPSPITIQTKCAACEEEKLHRKKEEGEEESNLQLKTISDLPVQRKCTECEDENILQKKASGSIQLKPATIAIVQRKCEQCEEEDKNQSIQLKPSLNYLQKKSAACEQDEIIHQEKLASAATLDVSPSVYQTLQSGGMPLDSDTRYFMESRFKYDFNKVRIHNDSLAHQSSADINALAYTHNSHISFAAGQYQPNTYSGKHLLAHELTHVVQQSAANAFSNNTLNRKEEDDEKPLTRYQEIEQSIDSPGEFEVLENPFGISIYNFAINRFYLKSEHKNALRKIGKMLTSGRSFSLQVLLVGNTDSTGSAAINDPLSVRRAKSVRNYLVDVTGKRYKVEGEGEDMPITTNETYSGRSRNRRVDILIDHPTLHTHHDLKPNGLILPPAYFYIAQAKIYRDELYNKDQKSCPWPWSCIDIPWIWPWFPIPKCVKLAILCEEDPEACIEFYEECIKDKDEDKKPRRACPIHVDLPQGDLPMDLSWPFIFLHEPFYMSIDFDDTHENGCFCECGEYEQKVRGFFEKEYVDGRVVRESKPLTPGIELEENTFHEDGEGKANSEYGHRSHPPRLIQTPRYFFIDKFSPTQNEGCTYIGIDHPSFEDGIAKQDEVRRTWFLEFEGQPVDTCAETGKRTPMEQYKHTWRIRGEIVAPPPVTKPVIPGGSQPGSKPGKGVKLIRATGTKAKTNPSKSYPSSYGGGIDAKAQVGQEFDMHINFHVSGKSDTYTYVVHIKVIDPTNTDFITVITANDIDLNIAPPNESEIVLKAHKKMRLVRNDVLKMNTQINIAPLLKFI